MTTYRFTPNQLTLLGFVLGASAAITDDASQVTHLHKLAQKAVEGANSGTLSLDEPDNQYVINAIEANRASIPNSSAWPQAKSGLDELIATFRAGITKGTQAAGATGR